ncbi:hypothetical protein [Arthrobacter oryzae]|jgi:uncharacterized protein with PQ loop repeat|uniref:hypothetical protein n=1 Tax=Arthrobacter oryzae TaxID=409290 RepID=UPI002860B023|nr:hypothetical protein [Arthrobacter oryzae]MDR6505408.1 uncharacterized protein with PQ loop repeat [Arthrobacter oryzae]
MNLPVLAGTLSTVLFAAGMLPMLIKAARTRDLASYSLGNLVLSNVANIVHSLYVFNLPAGPIWALHLAYVFASALMLAWWLRYREAGQDGTGSMQAGRQESSAMDITTRHQGAQS